MKTPRAMILAAGFGTRLGELTQHRPKPMLPIAGAPLVRWAVRWLREQGVREIVINLHHMGDQIEAELADGKSMGVDITYSHEEGKILGTGGGLRDARHLLDDGKETPILALNGKILFELELGSLLEQHRKHGREATMVLRSDREAIWGGKLAVGEDERLATFLGETREGSKPGLAMMFTGIQLFQPSFLDRVPPEGEQCIVRSAYRSLFQEGGGGIGTYVSSAYWWEHSTVERYLQGIANVLDAKIQLPTTESHHRGIHPAAEIDPTAKVDDKVFIGEGAKIGAGCRIGPYVQIGAGAKIQPGLHLEHCAVWPMVAVTKDLRQEVAHSSKD